MTRSVELFALASPETFSEAGYLDANPDVRALVAAGRVANAREHFERYGRAEGRRLPCPAPELAAMRADKLERLAPYLRDDLPSRRRDGKPDYLSDELVRLAGIAETANVSQNSYDGDLVALVTEAADGLVLDCGAGRRDRYYANVVNLEIVDYESTDVLGIGEVLPFRDASFDAVISVAVLEHVRDPFACAREIVRVLKPGGRLACAVPFLQPVHGYPHHYYNMTAQGLRALFEGALTIERQFVPASLLPVWSLTWIVKSWAAGLPPAARKRFLSRRLSDFHAHPATLLGENFVTELPAEKNEELASGTYLFARKPG